MIWEKSIYSALAKCIFIRDLKRAHWLTVLTCGMGAPRASRGSNDICFFLSLFIDAIGNVIYSSVAKIRLIVFLSPEPRIKWKYSFRLMSCACEFMRLHVFLHVVCRCARENVLWRKIMHRKQSCVLHITYVCQKCFAMCAENMLLLCFRSAPRPNTKVNKICLCNMYRTYVIIRNNNYNTLAEVHMFVGHKYHIDLWHFIDRSLCVDCGVQRLWASRTVLRGGEGTRDGHKQW